MKYLLFSCTLLGLLLPQAHANVYSCMVDGEKVYTNKKLGNCQTEKLDKIGSYTSDRSIIERQNRYSNASLAAERNNYASNDTPATPAPVTTTTTPTKRAAVTAAPISSAVRNNRIAPTQTTTARPVPTIAPVTVNTNTPAPSLSGRDQGRREILMNELSNEKKALAQARLALTNGSLIRNQPDARKQQSMSNLQRAVEDRQHNIQALQNELARM